MSSNGYHCEVVGSLLRPTSSSGRWSATSEGEIDPQELKALQDKDGLREHRAAGGGGHRGAHRR